MPLPSDADILFRLRAWEARADAATVFAGFDALRAQARAALPAEQFRSRICGKSFWAKVVLQELTRIDPLSDWLLKLASWSAVPPDLEAILRPMLA